MNNTALRAEVQSTNNTHMVFANEEHEKFYFEKLKQARYQDCYRKALIYILGISEDTRNHFSQIYDIKSGYIQPECLHQGWRTSGSVRAVRLAFNLYTDGMPNVGDYGSEDGRIRECKAYCNAAHYSRREPHFIFDRISTITACSFRRPHAAVNETAQSHQNLSA